MLALLMGLALAQEFHVVFDLTGTLVQGIPRKVSGDFDASKLVDSGKLFVLSDHTKRMLTELLRNPNVKVSVFSEIPAKYTQLMVDAIQVNGASLGSQLHKTLALEDLTQLKKPDKRLPEGKAHEFYEKDLSKVDSDLNNVILVDDEKGITQGQHLDVGPSYFRFKDFTTSQKIGATPPKGMEHRFAPSQAEYDRELDKLSQAYGVLTQAIEQAETKGINLKTAVGRVTAGKTRDQLMKEGQHLLSLYLEWVYGGKPKRVKGCMEKSSLNKGYKKAVHVSRCKGSLPITHQFTKATPPQCILGTAEGVALTSVKSAECEKRLPLNYHWADKKLKGCGIYTEDNYFIRSVPTSECEARAYTICYKDRTVEPVDKLSIEGKVYPIVSEILGLKDGETVPASVYKKYPTKVIGLSIVERIHRKRDAKDRKPAYDFMDDAEIHMAFDMHNFDGIKKNCFLNQHQNGGGTNGCACPTSRADAEDGFAGINLESSYNGGKGNPVNTVRPKYSFLGIQETKGGMDLTSYSSGYGNVIAVLKDGVKMRTTFTPGDSLGMHGNQVHSLRHQPKNISKKYGYWEAQVWGEVCLGDVEYFMVNCSYMGKGNVSGANLKKLKSNGHKVYQCNQTPGKNGMVLKPGKKL